MANAIILAGGFGTRLRPLSCTVPKPMLPVLNKPLLHFIISRMHRETPGLERIVVAVNYRANDIKAYMDKLQETMDVEIHVQEEKRPLGTGGAVRFSKHLLDGDPFFMLNGDVLSSFSYPDMLDFHQAKGGIATISAIHVEDVSRYGVIVADEDNLIHEFFEKPSTQEELKKYHIRPINAGTYLLEPDVFDIIPPNKKLSIEREVFPTLVERRKAYKYEFSGVWKDLGLPEDFLEGNFQMLVRETERQSKSNLIDDGSQVSIGGDTSLVAPVCIDEDVTIGQECEIGPNVIIGKGCEIGDGVKLTNCVLSEHCLVDNFASIDNVIMLDGVKVGRWAHVKGLGIFGANVSIEENVTLVASDDHPIRACPWKNISKEAAEKGSWSGMMFM